MRMLQASEEASEPERPLDCSSTAALFVTLSLSHAGIIVDVPLTKFRRAHHSTTTMLDPSCTPGAKTAGT